MSKRIGGFRLVLAALLTTQALSKDSLAEPAPWFDEFLVQFPDALLLEQEPVLLPPSSERSPVPAVSSMTRTSFEDALVLEPVPEVTDEHSVVVPETSPRSLSPSRRRYVFCEHCQSGDCEYWQLLPDGILYPSYIAGEKEPRMAAAVLNEKDRGPIFEATIGGRLGLVRYGTPGPINPQGWQWDLESAAMLRQDFQEELDVDATDFRIGSVLTWKRGPTAIKGGFYHLSSHVGDEFLERNPGFQRRNYSRDAFLVGIYHFVTNELALYGEIAYSVKNDGGSEPLEFQFGAEYASCKAKNPCGAPFAAINYHAREEFDYGGALNILAGWEWRGPTSDRRLRIGGQFYSGKEIQWSFFDENITLVGIGIWYDF